jgi:hypothetical protein
MSDRSTPDLERAAVLLAAILGPDGVLVGGLAVGAHGYVRATDDVDFVASVPLPDVLRRLRARGIDASLRRGDSLEGDFDTVQGTIAGVRFDVMPQLVPIDWSAAIEVTLGRRQRLRVVDLDALVRLKLRAQGPRDLMDVAALVAVHPETRESTRETARAYGALEGLDRWLADARLARDVGAPSTAKRRKPRKTRSRAK